MSLVTKHGEQRIKDRIGLSKKISQEICDKALKDGIAHKETTGSLCKYLDKIYLQYKRSNNTRIYHEKVFLFNNETLITVLDLPNNFKRLVEKIKLNKKNEKVD